MTSGSGRVGALNARGVDVTATWDRKDGHRVVTVIAMILAGIAITMAIAGLPPVDLHGPLHKMGIMDPLCGGTRSARYTAQGNLVEAWRYNPLGIFVVLGSLVVVLRTTLGLLSRRWLNISMRISPRARLLAIGLVVVLTVLLEIRQQMRADLLITNTSTWV